MFSYRICHVAASSKFLWSPIDFTWRTRRKQLEESKLDRISVCRSAGYAFHTHNKPHLNHILLYFLNIRCDTYHKTQNKFLNGFQMHFTFVLISKYLGLTIFFLQAHRIEAFRVWHVRNPYLHPGCMFENILSRLQKPDTKVWSTVTLLFALVVSLEFTLSTHS